MEFAEALDAERPGPRRSGHDFELPNTAVIRYGTDMTGFADLFEIECYLFEGKAQEA